MFTRPFALIALTVVFVLILLFGFSFAFQGEEFFQSLTAVFGKGVEFEGDLVNGNLFAYQFLQSTWYFIPLLVVFVTGGMISEEKSQGTLKMILSRPVSRTGFLSAKFGAAAVYILILIVLIALFTLGAGLLFFGNGELLAFDDGKFTLISANRALLSFAIAYGYYFLVLFSVASLSLLFSVLFTDSVKSIMVTASIILALYFISNLNIPFFESVRPFLFTSYFSSWSKVFTIGVSWMNFSFDIILLVVHILVFYGLAMMFFGKKEILD
jgi:ABC-2 type transport system permease protein